MYTIGKNIRFTLYGKSHGPHVGCILEGLPEGFRVDFAHMAKEMDLRRPTVGIGTPRAENDTVEIVGGIRDGLTDGSPIEIRIANGDTDCTKYLGFKRTPRPGHADLPALTKDPEHDICGGGQFSGRLTAPIVAAGSIAKQFIEERGVRVAAYSKSIGGISDVGERDFEEVMKSRTFPTRACTRRMDASMKDAIMAAAKEGDSVGGVVECVTVGMPLGFGGIWFEALDSEIARAVFSIPACKGVEFGKGFDLAKMRGSESNDPFRVDGGVKPVTGNMGGILGGMSDGSPMVFRAVFKPTPSIAKEQDTVDLMEMKNAKLSIEGRHDPCIVPRAVAAVEAITALVIADQMVR